MEGKKPLEDVNPHQPGTPEHDEHERQMAAYREFCAYQGPDLNGVTTTKQPEAVITNPARNRDPINDPAFGAMLDKVTHCVDDALAAHPVPEAANHLDCRLVSINEDQFVVAVWSYMGLHLEDHEAYDLACDLITELEPGTEFNSYTVL